MNAERGFLYHIDEYKIVLTLYNSIKYEQEDCPAYCLCTSKIQVCPTCKNRGFILAPDDTDKTDKLFIEECPECNS